jgi:hypothetical protein
MRKPKDLTQIATARTQPSLRSTPGGGFAHSTVDAEWALEQMLVNQARTPTCIAAEGRRFATDRFQARLARDPLLEPRSTTSPLVAIRLTRALAFPEALVTHLCEALTGTDGNGEPISLRRLMYELGSRETSVIAIDGFHQALVAQNMAGRARLIDLLAGLLRPNWPALPINLVITGIALKDLFSQAHPLLSRSRFISLDLNDAYCGDNPAAIDGLTHFIAYGNCCWGKGETIEEAVALMQRGNDFSDPRYAVYRVHKSCVVTDYGTFLQDRGPTLPQQCLDRMQVSGTSSIDESPQHR